MLIKMLTKTTAYLIGKMCVDLKANVFISGGVMLNLNPKEIDYHKHKVSNWFWAFVIACCISIVIIGVLKVDNHNLGVRLDLKEETIQLYQASETMSMYVDMLKEIKNGELKELPSKELSIKSRGGIAYKHCPYCETKTLCTKNPCVSKTLMMWDMENGEDPNITTTTYRCSNCNKTFEVKEQYGKELPNK